MAPEFVIRDAVAGDQTALNALYPRAFPAENLRPLVAALLAAPDHVLSLVAQAGPAVLGHAACTLCGIEGHDHRVAILGPLVVDPDHKARGIGGALIREGLKRMETAGAVRICLLGDPAYYGKFGFAQETAIEPPYPLPAEWRAAWLSKELGGHGKTLTGRMTVPPPWQDPALWGPGS